MSGHTPGPWKVGFVDDELEPVVKTSEEHAWYVATVHDFGDAGKTSQANARLIAAAPELLEEAEKQVEALRVAHITPSPGLVAAIMKARGGR